MNGTLDYTYQWDNTAPTSTFNSAVQKTNGTGDVDLSMKVNDVDGQDSRVKIEYATGTACNFATSSDPTIDSNPADISADYGTPVVDNSNPYQIGTTTGWITTS